MLTPLISLGSTTYLPVLGLTLEQHWVLRLAHLTLVSVLDVLGLLLSLDTVILGKGTLMASTAGMGEEVGANGLDAALSSTGELTNGLEVLVSGPALREARQRQGNCRDRSHLCR